MSVWPNSAPPVPGLLGTEGELVSVSVFVEPRRLEELLEALTQVDFPINPQIYHQAATVVEFPAYAGRIREVRAALARSGFDHGTVQVRSMLDELRASSVEEPAPAGAPYRTVIR